MNRKGKEGIKGTESVGTKKGVSLQVWRAGEALYRVWVVEHVRHKNLG